MACVLFVALAIVLLASFVRSENEVSYWQVLELAVAAGTIMLFAYIALRLANSFRMKQVCAQHDCLYAG
jgi:hypothetical protein